MNDFTKAAIQRYIDMNHLFLSLLQGKQFNEDTLKLMKGNHDMMKSALIDLGVVFDETDRIRTLNNRIHEMEETFSAEGLNSEKISSYVNNLSQQIRSALEEQGLHCSVSVSFSPNMVAELSFYSSQEKEGMTGYYRTEEEQQESIRKNSERHAKLIHNFKCFEGSHGDEKYLAYSSANILKILGIVAETVDDDISHHSMELNPRYSREDNKTKTLMPTLSTLTITFLTLASHKSFSEALASRY